METHHHVWRWVLRLFIVMSRINEKQNRKRLRQQSLS